MASIGLSERAKPSSSGAVCGVAAIVNLMLVCLDGKSHEIDPIQYKSVSPESLISVSRLNRHVHVLWASAVLIPVIATVMDSGLSTTWINSTRLLLSAVLINIYLVAIDMLARLTLCKYKVNLKRLVEELTDDTSNEYTLDAMLSIILHEDTVLVKEVGSSTRNLGTVKIEEEEVTRNEDATGKMARVLVDGRGIIGGLESDILRALTLESLGGNAGNAAQATVNIMSSERHMKAIGDWVAADAKLLVAQREPLAIAIVRALCAYAGGIGVCLQQEISLRPVQSWEIPPLARDGPAPSTRPATPSYHTWTLPPAATRNVECAIVAATRFVVHSITHSSNAALDWRSGHLSMMVPVVLCAASELRKGLNAYLDTIEKEQPLYSEIRKDAHHIRRLKRLRSRCEDVAICIVETLRSLEGLRYVDINVHNSDCRAWLDSILRSGTGEAQPTPFAIDVVAAPKQIAFAFSPKNSVGKNDDDNNNRK